MVVVVDDAPLSAAEAGRKRGRARREADAAFDTMLQQFPMVGASNSHREAFIKDGSLTCLTCGTVRSAANVSNFRAHLKTGTHTSALAAAARTPNVLALQRAAAAAVVPKAHSLAVVTEVQSLLAVAAINYAVPADVPLLLGGPLFAAAAVLQQAGKPLTVGGTMDRALDDGLVLVRKEMTNRLRGNSMCVVIDEATTRLAGYRRPMAVILGCSAVGKPLLAKLMFDKPTAVEAAAGIRDALALYEVDIATQVTCVVGDNAALVDAIAAQLGLPRLRCIPHCLHLVFKKGTAGFKRWVTVTQGLSRILTQGGTPYRLIAMRVAGLKCDRLRGNPLRWGQMQDISRYLLEKHDDVPRAGVMEKVRAIVGSSGHFEAPAGEASSDDSDDGPDIAAEDGDIDPPAATAAAAAAAPTRATRLASKTALSDLRQALEVGIAESRRKFLAAFECYLVEVLFGDLPKLLTAACADPERLHKDLDKELAKLRAVLEEATEAGMQGVVLARVFEHGMTDFTDDEQAQLISKYSDVVRTAAASALAQYDKFIPGALDSLRHRLRFHPGVMPTMITPAPGKNIDATDLEAFFGMAKGAVTLQVASEWRKYVREWPGMTDGGKARSAAVFWAAPDIIAAYPSLAKLGRWYADMPTSSVAAERAFGVMRAMESKLRCRMDADTVERELMMKVNSWVVDELLHRALAAAVLPKP